MKLLLVTVLFAVLAAGQPLTDIQMKAEMLAVGCLEQHKTLNKDHLLLLKDGDFSKVDAETKCFLRCFLQQAKVMDEAGNLQSDYAIERLSLHHDMSKVEALVRTCSVEPSEDSCETAFRAVECYHREKVSLL